MIQKRIGVIGGGAAGMLAAIYAARAGAAVTILEKRDSLGKKIMVTGNGKCNLSNLSFCSTRDYNCSDKEKLSFVFGQFGVQDTLEFFYGIGLMTADKEGYVYPKSGQAQTVVTVLLNELNRLKVKICPGSQVKRIYCLNEKGEQLWQGPDERTAAQKEDQKAPFIVVATEKEYYFDRLILACGSAAGTRKKEGLGGYWYAQMLGHKVSDLVPALVQLHCEGHDFSRIAGVRQDAKAVLFCDNKVSYEEFGEIQITDYGLSGIPIFQFSRFAAEELKRGHKPVITLDFYPEISTDGWKEFCRHRFESFLGRSIMECFCGLIHNKLALLLLEENGLDKDKRITLEDKDSVINTMMQLKCFVNRVEATNPLENAQVCAGGVLLDEVSNRLESMHAPGLFLAGEMLDVDGRCGGYNLQWAFSSGALAGMNASGNDER